MTSPSGSAPDPIGAEVPAPEARDDSRPPPTEGRAALLVATGIFLSRIFGLVRGKVMAHYFGIGDVADAFTVAVRAPNFLQNLFGEGVLSASFIPVYARLVAQGDREGARRVADAVFTLLALVTSVLVLLGILVAPWFVPLITPGFSAEKQALTVRLVQILFPGVGLLAMSAWCLGILNSHRRFFLSYAAPVAWNVSIIGAILLYRDASLPNLAVYAAWGSVAGSALQFLMQLPGAWGLVGGIRLGLHRDATGVATVARNFVPSFVGRGVVQISAWIDQILASLISSGAVAAIGNAQVVYMLPVSLFGMAVSAAELPAMSSVSGARGELERALAERLRRGLRRISFFIVPSVVAFLVLGDAIVAALYQSGRFTPQDTRFVWMILAGYSLGLLAATLGRLYSSAFYALHDTRTPLRYALVRVVLATSLGYLLALHAPTALDLDRSWGAPGLTAAAGLAAWVEFVLLRRALRTRVGGVAPDGGHLLRLWGAAFVAAAAGYAVRRWIGLAHPVPAALAIVAVYAAGYAAATLALGVPEAREVLGRLRRTGSRLRGRRG